MLCTQSRKVWMGMSLKMRTSLRSTSVPGLMPKRFSTPDISSLISASRAGDSVASDDLDSRPMEGMGVLEKLGAGVLDLTVRALSTAVRICEIS